MTETEIPGATDRARGDRGWRLLILGSSLLIFCVSTIYGLLHGFDYSQQSWRGYFTLAVDASMPVAELDALLAGAGIDDSINQQSAKVVLGTPAGLRAEPIALLDSLKGTMDPRVDGYLRTVDAFFSDQTHAWNLVYIPVHDGMFPLMFKLGRVLGPHAVAWQIMEWRPVQGLFLLAAAVLAGGLVLRSSRGRRGFTLLCLIPWLPPCMMVGPAFFSFQVASLLSWSLLMETLLPALKRFSHDVPKAPFFWDRPTDAAFQGECRRHLLPFLDLRSLGFRAVVFLAIQVMYLMCLGFSNSWHLLPGVMVVNLLAWPSLLVLLARFYQLRHRRSEHMLFAPVPMLTTKRVLITSLRPILLPILSICILLPLVFLFALGGSGAVPVPVPGGYSYGGIAWRNAMAAETAASASPLPDAAGMVKHLAFQAALPFSKDLDWRNFKLAEPGAKLAIPIYEFTDEGVTTKAETRIEWGDAWLRQAFAAVPACSVDRLLLDQGRMSGLVFATAGKVYSADVWIFPALAGLVVLVIPFWLAGRNPGFRQLYGSSRITAMGRKVAA